MAFVGKFFNTVRTHWKKSIFFTAAGAYGIKYGIEKYEDEMLRRQYCAEAKVYGDQKANAGEKNRKITVFLNPAASGSDSKKLFEKNAAPILYLAGLEVNVVKTEYDGQIKEFFKYLERKHVDGVVVAGGNGALLETVTGIMRKEDREFRQQVPVGIIPTGKTNKFATFFYGPDKHKVRRMLDSAMAVVKGETQKLDVLKIEGEDGRTTFALCGLEMGAYESAKEKAPKYWYYGPLKHRFSYVWTTIRSWPTKVCGDLEFIEAKETDIPKKKEKKQQEEPKQSQSWMSSLLRLFVGQTRPVKREVEEEEEEEEYENEELMKKDLKTLELTMSSDFYQQPTAVKGVHLGIGLEEESKWNFITKGWERMKNPVWKMGSEENEHILCRKIRFVPKAVEGSPLWYSIDGEQYEAMPVEVSLLKNRLKIFTIQDKSPS